MLEGAEQSRAVTSSDGYSGKIFQDEMEGAAAGGRYQGLGRRQREPGVGQGLRKPLTLETRLMDAFVPGRFQLKETSPWSSLAFLPTTQEISFLSLFQLREKKPTLCS